MSAVRSPLISLSVHALLRRLNKEFRRIIPDRSRKEITMNAISVTATLALRRRRSEQRVGAALKSPDSKVLTRKNAVQWDTILPNHAISRRSPRRITTKRSVSGRDDTAWTIFFIASLATDRAFRVVAKGVRDTRTHKYAVNE